MSKEKIHHKYLLRLYSKVDDYLTSSQNSNEDLPDIIVSFCVVVEKILKIKLYEKNPVLVFENTKIKENDALIAIITKKEKNIETIKILETIDRFKLLFNDIFSDDELQALIDIYLIRNNFVHGYKSDEFIDFGEEDVIKKLGTIWEKVSIQAILLFGKDSIKMTKPKKKYSEEELEEVLIEEVRKKIQSTGRESLLLASFTSSINVQDITRVNQASVFSSAFSLIGERCPRCGSSGFSLDSENSGLVTLSSIYNYGRTFSDLYKCKSCGLELTRKEYEIAKKLKE